MMHSSRMRPAHPEKQEEIQMILADKIVTLRKKATIDGTEGYVSRYFFQVVK